MEIRAFLKQSTDGVVPDRAMERRTHSSADEAYRGGVAKNIYKPTVIAIAVSNAIP
jgi:hypothetical protein